MWLVRGWEKLTVAGDMASRFSELQQAQAYAYMRTKPKKVPPLTIDTV